MALLSYRFCRRFTALAGGFVLSLAVALGPASAQSPPQLPSTPRGPDGIADVIEQVIDSVVLISTAQNVDAGADHQKAPAPELSPNAPLDQFFDDFFERQKRGENEPRPTGEGSGFVIDASGTIVTNFHVVDGADRVEVVFNDGTKLAAEVVGKDKEIDVAVLKVKPVAPLKPVRFGDPDSLRVGEWVLALGNPFGIGLSATSGIVSGRNRDMRTGKYDNFIQTDASINKGNSGGPLFNLAGEVIGVNTAILSPTGGSVGIGFAVPTSAFRPVVAQLLEFGEARRGYIGVRIQDVPDEIAKRLAMKNVQGALIAQTVDGGPAAHAGIKKGDVVVSFDGKPVATSRALQRFVADAPIDRDVDVLIWRDGSEIRTKVKVARLDELAELAKPAEDKPATPPAATGQVLGLDVAPLNDDVRGRFKIDPTIENGVVIVAVRPESPLKDANLRIGETIVEIGQKKIGSVEEMKARLAELKNEGQASALALIVNPVAEMRYLRMPVE